VIAVAVFAGLTAYLAALGVDWRDDTVSPLARGIAAAFVLELAAVSIIAGVWIAVA